jgi:hypothetical protein
MKMAQALKRTKAFKTFGVLNPGTVRVSPDNLKDAAILSRCAILTPATADL